MKETRKIEEIFLELYICWPSMTLCFVNIVKVKLGMKTQDVQNEFVNILAEQVGKKIICHVKESIFA